MDFSGAIPFLIEAVISVCSNKKQGRSSIVE